MGQNFLISEDVLSEIMSAASVRKDDTVLEAGPGLGMLTEALAKKARFVVTIEKDPFLLAVLRKKFKEEKIQNVLLQEGDILTFSSDAMKQFGSPYMIVANIPYYLTARFLRKFLSEESFQPSSITLLLQREVAERIAAHDSRESILSLSIRAYG
ncbi:MAG: 16S rRNA (adenine(1518)-N(6)/adenine(1519)-N(6))-dimethyltransferase, partial [Candidatus Sungbacteria bacterium]|nr:16S rRNA (adenine(1518)-N(6)/adenine(1519)-N(6))-dimethyltransferase [Candidatus Sungbacteria bacterium]